MGYPNKPIWFAIGKLQGIEMEKTFKGGKPTTHEMGRNGPPSDVKPENMLLQLLLSRSLTSPYCASYRYAHTRARAHTQTFYHISYEYKYNGVYSRLWYSRIQRFVTW